MIEADREVRNTVVRPLDRVRKLDACCRHSMGDQQAHRRRARQDHDKFVYYATTIDTKTAAAQSCHQYREPDN